MKFFKKLDELVGLLRDHLSGEWGKQWREAHWRKRLMHLGSGVIIGERFKVSCPDSVQIGDEFTCWRDCVLCADKQSTIVIGEKVGLNVGVYINSGFGHGIRIGNQVMIGPLVMMRASKHKTDDVGRPMQDQGHEPGEIIIEDDVWIGAGVVISGTVRVGTGAVIGANSVVTRDVPPYSFVGGVPAKIIRDRGKEKES
ncbi:MAG: acyltransferase [Candidatus Methylacidiphilales bacterium]